MRKKIIYFILFLVLIFIIFNSWFTKNLIIGGDLTYFFPNSLKNFTIMPYAWYSGQNNGMGGSEVSFLWIYVSLISPIAFLYKYFNLAWSSIEKISFLFPFIILSFLSPLILFYKLFRRINLLPPLIFMLNTYILMVIGGGQILVALSYAFVPITLTVFIILINKSFWVKKNIVLYLVSSSLAFFLQVLLDLRLAYITMWAVILYFIINTFVFLYKNNNLRFKLKTIFNSVIISLVVPNLLAAVLHIFWIMPLLAFRQNPLAQLGAAYDSAGAVKFFSFATFENTLSLLHPNWPENIFGKIYFMRPEFLLLPILAFSSLLFLNYPVTSDELRIKNKKRINELRVTNDELNEQIGGLRMTNDELRIRNKKNDTIKNAKYEMRNTQMYIIYFALLGLLGAFLAKGANDPFGGIYLWLFAHVPGFVMFRDPTKWYLLIAISYSMLIPFTVEKIYSLLNDKFSN